MPYFEIMDSYTREVVAEGVYEDVGAVVEVVRSQFSSGRQYVIYDRADPESCVVVYRDGEMEEMRV